MLRLSHHLFAETADAAKMDYYERALYKRVLGKYPPCPA
jgi:DUF1680 family protein